MTRRFIDNDLITWTVHASTGLNSLPEGGRLIFVSATDPDHRPRVAPFGNDLVEAAAAVGELSDADLRRLLGGAHELE